MGRASKSSQEILANLIAQFVGPIGRMFGGLVDAPIRVWSAAIALGLISGHPLVVCEVVGSKQKFREFLIKELIRMSNQPLSKLEMQRAVNAEIKRQQIRGVRMEGSTKMRWIVLADDRLIKDMPTGLSPTQRAQWLAKSITTVEAMEATNLSRWRTWINSDLRAGIVTAVLQVWILSKVEADAEKSLANERFDADVRKYAATGAIVGTTVEIIGSALAGIRVPSLRLGRGLASIGAEHIQKLGKGAGMAAGLLVAILDFRKAFVEYQDRGSGLLVVAYVGSAVIGGGLSLALFFAEALGAAAVPIIGLLVALLIAVAMLIEHIKDNPVQDWLERCPWGNLPEQRYPDYETESAQLAQALK